MEKTFDENYLQAVRRKLEKQGKSDEEVEKYIDDMKGVEKGEVREVPKITVPLRFCSSCDSKGVRHKKDCPNAKSKTNS